MNYLTLIKSFTFRRLTKCRLDLFSYYALFTHLECKINDPTFSKTFCSTVSLISFTRYIHILSLSFVIWCNYNFYKMINFLRIREKKKFNKAVCELCLINDTHLCTY